jgi:hypothetical protein
MEHHIQILKLSPLDDFKCLYARFDFIYYGNDTDNRYTFSIFWDNDAMLPVLYYKYEYYRLQLPEHNAPITVFHAPITAFHAPITVFHVLQYLGISNVSISIEYSHISEWNTSELTDEIMRSTIKYGYTENYKYRLQSL